MGFAAFMALLRFLLLCVRLLSWPAIALGYPLFASIKAVESGSKYHMKKLVMYWTLFSLFSLFEFAFVKIIEWIPFWSSVRLAVIFWLVMPGFDGSNHAYQSLVRPILLMKLQAVIKRFNELREERICKSGTVSNVVEKYIKENGPEAVEKLIALEHENQKWMKSQRESKVLELEGKSAAEPSKLLIEHRAAPQDGETLLATEKIAVATQSLQISYAQSTSLVNRKDAAVNVKETATTTEASADNGRSMTPPLMKTQQEWTCDVCKVTGINEKTLNAHLNGRKHKSKIESLKASLLGAKDTRPPSPLLIEPEAAPRDCETIQSTKNIATATQSHQIPYALSTSVNRKDAVVNVKGTTTPEASIDNRQSMTPPLLKTQQGWTCDICKVTDKNAITLNAHLNSLKHKSKMELLKASMLGATDTRPSSPLVQHKQSAAKVKTIMPTIETAEKGCLETPPIKNTQQEWTCDLCKVTTTSEIMLNSHFHGCKHKSNLEILKTSKFGAKVTAPSDSETSKIILANVCETFIEETGSKLGKIITSKMQIKAKEPASLEANAENSQPKTPLKQARQEWTLKASNLGAKVASPSHSATSKLNLANVFQKFIEESDSEPEKTITPKTQIKGKELSSREVSDVNRHPKVASPSHSAISKLNLDNVSEKFIEESASALENTITSKLQVQVEAKKTTPPEASVGNSQTDPALKLAQQEWACDLCKVKATNENSLNDHLQGKKHKSKLDSLKASMLGAKDTGPSPLVQLKQSAAEVENIMPIKETAGQRCQETTPLKKAQQEWTCDLCKVTTASEIELNDHFHGSKHKSKLETLKASNIGAKVTDPSHSATGELNLANVCENFVEETGSELDKIISSKMQTKAKELSPPEASAENGLPETPPKKARQEWTLKASNLGAKVASPSHSAISNLNLANVSEKFIEESASALKNTITSKVQVEAKKTAPPEASVENSHTETPLKLAQQEWACDLCKVKATNENSLNDHLQGEKHKSKLDSLKARVLGAKDTGPSPLVQLKQSAAKVENIMPIKETAAQRCQETTPLKKVQKEWKCDLCKVTTTSEMGLNDHFHGSKHKSKLESLKASNIGAKVTDPSHSATGELNLANVCEDFLEETGSELDKIISSKMQTKAKELTSPEASAENGLPKTPPKQARQEWTSKASNLGAKVASPSHSAISNVNLADVSEKFIEESGSDLDNIITSKVQVEAKEATPLPVASIENSHTETPLKLAQQVWACDLCKVKVASENILNAHLQGKKHKSKLDSIKASVLGAKDARPSPLVPLKQSAAEVHIIMPTKETAGKGCQETTPLEAQQEWTCDLYKVTATSEIALNDHLHGSKHNSKLETLKESYLGAKVTDPSHSATSKSDTCNVSDKCIEESGSGLENVVTSKVQIDAEETPPPEASPENRHAETPPLELARQEWTCDLCKVKAPCEKTLNGHFKGKKHLAKLESLKKASVQIEAEETTPPEASAGNRHAETPPLELAQREWTCDLCKVKAPCEKTLNGHLKGKKHKAKLEALKKASSLHTNDTGLSTSATCGNKDGDGIIRGKMSEEWCFVCNVKLLSDVDLASHLRGERHSSNIQALISYGL